MSTTISQGKDNPFTTSYQVKKILHSKGFSFLFNWEDYNLYKEKCKKAFNKAYSIANYFLEDAENESDFQQYPF